MTVSFHKYNGDFFPGTGKLDDNGTGLGKHFSLNVPLQDGIDDDSYVALFKDVMRPTIEAFQPSSIVLQCGADSLGCDRLGAFNISINAHGECVKFIKDFNLPLLILGGGGYTIRNVSRCWTYETSILLNIEVPEQLPDTLFNHFFVPDHALHPKIVKKVDNLNTPKGLEKIRTGILEKLRYLQGAPSVQMSEIPPDLARWMESEERLAEAEDRDEDEIMPFAMEGPKPVRDPHRPRNEFYDRENDNDGDEDSVAATPAPTVPVTKKPTRGRGRGKNKTAAAARPTANGEEEAGEKEPPRARRTGARRGRGRGRGKAKESLTRNASPPAASPPGAEDAIDDMMAAD